MVVDVAREADLILGFLTNLGFIIGSVREEQNFNSKSQSCYKNISSFDFVKEKYFSLHICPVS